MAVASSTYGTVARVEARVGDIVSGRSFGASTQPTLTQVEALLDDVAEEMNAVLDMQGYDTPIDESEDPFAFGWARRANSSGAAALVLDTVPGPSFDPESPDVFSNRKNSLHAEFKRFLDAVMNGTLQATRSTKRSDRFVVGSRTNEDGERKLPIFTRDHTRYPGRESLTEET